MGAVERAQAQAAAAKSTADALAALNPERLLAYADTWRRFAAQWTEQAKTCAAEHVEPLRTRAQLALFAAYEADELFKRLERGVSGKNSVRSGAGCSDGGTLDDLPGDYPDSPPEEPSPSIFPFARW